MPLSGNPTTIFHGNQLIETPGEAEALNFGNSLPVPTGISVLVIPEPDNSGIVYVADNDNTKSSGIPLEYPNAVALEVDDVAVINFDVDEADDGVRWAFEGGPL